jgi:flagellar hook-basal body protein
MRAAEVAATTRPAARAAPLAGFDGPSQTLAPNTAAAYVPLKSFAERAELGVTFAGLMDEARQATADIDEARILVIPPPLIQGIGSAVKGITQDFKIGPMEQTGSALDVAITGDGFFEVKGEGGTTMYTRNGSFALQNKDPAGSAAYVVDGSGNRLQSMTGDIEIAATKGTATFNGVTISSKALSQTAPRFLKVALKTKAGAALSDADVKDSIVDAGYEVVSIDRKA